MLKISKTLFVSSTFNDLEEHRKAAIEALHDIVWLKIMESRGAAAGMVSLNCLRWVRESDLYIGILGMCYGSRERETGKSFTELEYNEVKRLNLPSLIYLIDEDRHPLLPVQVDRGKDADDLILFKNKVLEDNHCGLFRSVEHLRYQIVRDMINLFNDFGWLREHENAASSEQSNEAEKQIQLCAWDSPEGILNLNTLSIGNKEKVVLAASILASRFEAGNFSDLQGIVSLRYDIKAALRLLLSAKDIDETALAAEIIRTRDGLYLRLLVDVAGFVRSKVCSESICERILRDSRAMDRDIKEQGYEMRPLLQVISDSLGQMPYSSGPIIRHYIEKARDNRNWGVKKALEKALKQIESGYSKL